MGFGGTKSVIDGLTLLMVKWSGVKNLILESFPKFRDNETVGEANNYQGHEEKEKVQS